MTFGSCVFFLSSRVHRKSDIRCWLYLIGVSFSSVQVTILDSKKNMNIGILLRHFKRLEFVITNVNTDF